jgi:hypothetical protein
MVLADPCCHLGSLVHFDFHYTNTTVAIEWFNFHNCTHIVVVIATQIAINSGFVNFVSGLVSDGERVAVRRPAALYLLKSG